MKKIKLFIDSIVEDLIRIILTTEDGKRKSLDVNVESLKTLLMEDEIVAGRSYSISFESDDDYNAVTLGRITAEFKPKGKIHIKDTTKQDLAAIRRLQKKLGLKI